MIPIVLLAAGFPLISSKTNTDAILSMAEKIEWFGQASVKIPFSDKLVYIDPYDIPKNDTPDYVFITHGHADHFDPNEVAKLNGKGVLIIAPGSCKKRLVDSGFENLLLVKPGDEFDLEGIKVKVVPAYNIVKTSFHPRENGWVGYVISYDGVSIYHAGDTERIPEMNKITCDIALVPLGQTYTMGSVNEAIEAIHAIKPTVAIPIHYGTYEGSENDAEEFKKGLIKNCRVIIKSFKNR